MSKLLHDANGLKTFAIVFDKDEKSGRACWSSPIAIVLPMHISPPFGAFSEVTLGFFDRGGRRLTRRFRSRNKSGYSHLPAIS